MREKINVLRHLAVLFLTVIIFFLGVFIGSNVEELRVESLYTNLQEQDVEYQNIVTENTYIEYLLSQNQQNNSQVSCDIVEKAYFTSIGNLDDSRKSLENYLATASSNEEEFYRLESHYANTQLNYLILAQRISKLCDQKINTIVYFYGNDEICPECEDQGVYLTYVKQQLQDDVLVFSFDISKEGPVELLKHQYNITSNGQLPRVVVNDEKLGFSTSQEVIDTLCEQGLKEEYC